MHNAAFRAKGLPFTYSLHDTTSILDVVKRMQEPDTALGGGSVTIPHKVDVMQYLDELTSAARAIGAVNTVIREDRLGGGVRWKGDNTDWLGILRPITKRLAGLAHQKHNGDLVALVVGAGGTSMAASYAMRQLDVGKLFIYNRTFAKAEEVAERFHAQALSSLTPELLASVDVVVSTIPAQAGFVLPNYLLQQGSHKVVVLDAAYQPPITPFLEHASKHGASCIQGFEMLYEQAIEQYNRWHKVTEVWGIDEEVMKNACLQHIPVDQRL